MWVEISETKKKSIFSIVISLAQASKYEDTYSATRKILEEFEGHDYWHCRHYRCESITIFQNGQTMVWKCGHLILPGAFLDNATSNIAFKDEAVVQCDVPVVKILL